MKRIKDFLFFIFLCGFSFSVNASNIYAVYDFNKNQLLESKNINKIRPIASITKLMTANVFLETNKNPNCKTKILPEDYDHLKGTTSKLPKNTIISCYDLLKAMLVKSDNYAAHALSRSAGISKAEFIQKMNQKARALGMLNTRFVDSSGLSPKNVSTVSDLIKLSKYSMNKSIIQNLSNTDLTQIHTNKGDLEVKNTNKLVREKIFNASLNKTGYINEAGYNLIFVNKYNCENNSKIGVISLNNSSSMERSNFTKNKLVSYGCFG